MTVGCNPCIIFVLNQIASIKLKVKAKFRSSTVVLYIDTCNVSINLHDFGQDSSSKSQGSCLKITIAKED